MGKKYYDPEYGTVVDEAEVKRQYEFFVKNYEWFDKTLEAFTEDNFRPTCKYIAYSESGRYLLDSNDIEALKDYTCTELGAYTTDDNGELIFAVPRF